MPSDFLPRRGLFAVVGCAGIVCGAASVAAAPLGPIPAPHAPALLKVQDDGGFLPRFLRREREPAQVVTPDSGTQVRLDQLETQVRNLTGQVEQLTFALRRLEAAVGAGEAPRPAQPGPGTPPQNLGTLPGPGGGQDANAAPTPGLPSGPIDLSALNNAPTANPPTATAPAPAAPSAPSAPANDGLASVRSLYDSGRYAMAQQEAEAILASNTSGFEAGEARFLLGEALFAQGQYREAANLYLENYTSDPNGSRAPASLMRLGRTLNELGEKEAACSSLEELFAVYPNIDGDLQAAAQREQQAAGC